MTNCIPIVCADLMAYRARCYLHHWNLGRYSIPVQRREHEQKRLLNKRAAVALHASQRWDYRIHPYLEHQTRKGWNAWHPSLDEVVFYL
ncbi:hypothetical protein M501DRAFT_1005179 [Patellaria atrata CBS 101060]|uniref:Uncharacterized protein n=1 Tax=Patellaria atrata CBS 101060 TaxID=1346257 RepID=A0A9P4S991_9PEZI|nr:hypothetical protein M501DRAFT_1005179 [Patellaria atrata CBS 101060]